jgi:1,2-diacylglycerol 3-alpha-glucosyltransferase
MRIAHLCLSCFYIDGFSYQENELVSQNVIDGHEVLVVASTETYDTNGKLVYLEPKEYLGTDGAKVIRIEYSKFVPKIFSKKIRKHPRILEILEQFQPNVILFHGICGFELLTVAKYKRLHPEVRFYADSHEDYNNSAKTLISKYVLHLGFYRPIVRYILSSIDKFFCVSLETIDFATELYGLPMSVIEFFPLGGVVLNDEEYDRYRGNIRRSLKISADEIVFVQTGKIDKSKKLLEALRAFQNLKDPKIRYLIAGYLHNDISAEVADIIKCDQRIQFVGWQSPEDLRALLCSADIYVQPGTQSATMQMSLCCRCAVVLADVPSHKPYICGNGWLVGENQCIEEIFSDVLNKKECIREMRGRSLNIAKQILDYKKLASRLYV